MSQPVLRPDRGISSGRTGSRYELSFPRYVARATSVVTHRLTFVSPIGDYVDRGLHSVETISLLTCLKLRYPERVQLIRGNHETRAVTQVSSFDTSCWGVPVYGDPSRSPPLQKQFRMKNIQPGISR